MKPEIGDIVLFTGGFDLLPAVVTHVWTDECVNLYVFQDAPYGATYDGPTTSVMFNETAPAGSYHWRWKGDHAKV